MAYYNILPPQMVTMADKAKDDQKWAKDTMNSLEGIARSQYANNIKLLENYEMIKGRFFYNHYVGDAGYKDMIQTLTEEFEMPGYLRHYDFISPVINTMSGEWQKRPDLFKVRDFSEKRTSEYKRKKTEELTKYVMTQIMTGIQSKMMEMGVDLNPEFETEEEAQQYQQMMDKTIKMMTPPELEVFMKTEYLTAAEIWGEHQLELDKMRLHLKEKEVVEFEDMLVSDRAFRHIFLTAKGHDQETWNPIHTFFHKAPEIYEVERGDYAGRIFQSSVSDIINRYGHLMTKKQIEQLTGFYNKSKDKKWNYAAGSEYVYNDYLMPFKGADSYDIMRKNGLGPTSGTGVQANIDALFDNVNNGSFLNEAPGYFYVVEGYWKAQKKIGLVKYTDPETGIEVMKEVDESFVTPDDFKTVDADFDKDQPINSVAWTWTNEVWKGIKICTTSYDKSYEDIYLDLKPLEIPLNGRLPVVGRVFSVRNSQSMSLVDLMKPYQIGWNLCINQAYQFAEKEIGAFMVFDVNMFPNSKDWGGEDAWAKWMHTAKAMGMVPADTSPQNMRGSVAAAGGTLPKILSLDFASQMVSRMEMAQFFKKMAMEQVGFNEYRLGTFDQKDTATGIQIGQQTSYAQTESYFTKFSAYVKATYEIDLEFAKFVQSKKKNIEVQFPKSDLTNAFIAVTDIDIAYTDLHCYLHDSQEYMRQLETIRQIGIQNNTSGATMYDLATMAVSNSPSEILNHLKQSDEYKKKMQEEQLALQQQQIAQQGEMNQFNEAKKDERLDKEQAFQAQQNAQQPQQYDPQADMMDLKGRDLERKVGADESKESLAREQMTADERFRTRQLDLQEKALNMQGINQDKKGQNVRIMKSEEL